MKYIKAIYKAFSLLGRKITHDAVAAFSAQTAFFVIISAFPFLVLVLSVLERVPFLSPDIIYNLSDIFPAVVTEYIRSIISEIFANNSATVISISAVALLWAASKGIVSIMRGLNFIYKIDDKRNFFQIRLTSVLYTLGFLLYILVTLLISVVGGRTAEFIKQGLPDNVFLEIIYRVVRTVGKFLLMAVFFALVYLVVPRRKTSVLSQLPGAVMSSLGWMCYSWFYAFYTDHFGRSAHVYGSMTSVVLIMLWLYVCMYIFFIGGEVNSIISGEDLWEFAADSRDFLGDGNKYL